MTWEKVKLGDIISTLKGFAFKSSLYSEGGIPIVRASNFTESSIDSCDLKYYSIENAVEYKKYELKKDDILVQTVGSWESNPNSVVGKVVCVPQYLDGALLNQNIVKIIPNQNINNRWLFFRLKCDDFKKHNIGSAVGAANQASVTLNTIRDFDLEIPPVETQHKIASILSAYDDLIENNKKQIKLLEEAAQRLYKEWFVDLRFPGHENVPVVDGVPEGWERCTLQDVIEFDPKIKLTKERIKQSVPMAALSTTSMVLDSKQFTNTLSNSGSKFQNGDTLLARITPCLENGKTAFVQGIESEEGAVGSTEYIVMRSKKLSPYMVYLLARTESFREFAINSMTGSDGRQRVNSDQLKTLEYTLPPQELIGRFGNIVSTLFDKIHVSNQQCITLAEQRDLLLPKLMSGELEV